MSSALFDVSGQIVLVSGGSRGIGLAIASAFAENGASVIITGRDETSLAQACEGVATVTGSVGYRVCDVALGDVIENCVHSICEEFGRIDTLINSAGINRRHQVKEFDAADFDAIMHTNVRGAFLMSQSVGRQMIARRSGCQINIDSLTSYAPFDKIVPYAMSKSAISNMTRGLAHEWGEHGVRVNGLAPGFIVTDLTRKVWAEQRMLDWHRDVAPLQRVGSPDDLTGTAIFLASPAAAFITGQTIRVDGGMSAGIRWPLADD